MWLARQALEGVPDVAPLSAAELAVVTGLDANVVGQDAGTLQGHINALPGSIVLFKMENVAMGRNLQARVEHIRGLLGRPADMRQGMAAQGTLSGLIARPATLRSLGRIAVFDLVVNNPDRFKPEGEVNLTNVDFATGGDVIALDNLDPNNRIDAQWQGRAALLDRRAMEDWANRVVEYLAEKLSYLGDAGNDLWPDFVGGMRIGIRDLRNLEGDLRTRVEAEPDAHRQELGRRLLIRIEALPD